MLIVNMHELKTDDPPQKQPRRMGTAKGRIGLSAFCFEPLDDALWGQWIGETLLPEDPLNPNWKSDQDVLMRV